MNWTKIIIYIIIIAIVAILLKYLYFSYGNIWIGLIFLASMIVLRRNMPVWLAFTISGLMALILHLLIYGYNKII